MKLIAAFALVFLVGSNSAFLTDYRDKLQALVPGMTIDEILATYHPCVIAAPDCGPGYCCELVSDDSTVGFCLPTVASGESCLVARKCACGAGYACVPDRLFSTHGKCLAV